MVLIGSHERAICTHVSHFLSRHGTTNRALKRHKHHSLTFVYSHKNNLLIRTPYGFLHRHQSLYTTNPSFRTIFVLLFYTKPSSARQRLKSLIRDSRRYASASSDWFITSHVSIVIYGVCMVHNECRHFISCATPTLPSTTYMYIQHFPSGLPPQ